MPSSVKGSQKSREKGNGILRVGGWSAEIPHVALCTPIELVVSPDAPPFPNPNTDPDSAPVQMYVHVYTGEDGAGAPCGPSRGCTRLTRRLPLRHSPDRKALVAKFLPDPAADHYVFELRVRHSIQLPCGTPPPYCDCDCIMSAHTCVYVADTQRSVCLDGLAGRGPLHPRPLWRHVCA